MSQDPAVEPETLTFNGVDATTGSYLVPPLSVERLAEVVRGAPRDPRRLRQLRWWVDKYIKGPPHRALKGGLNPRRLAEAGWGVVFAADADPALREALQPLLQHRRRQAAANHERHYREYWGDDGYRKGESKLDFLSRHGAGPGPADPAHVPYYLMIVGDPTQVPYRFQYQLDVQYAVGRLALGSPEEYHRYAEAVVDCETGEQETSPRATFFSVCNAGDRATELGTRHLSRPLAEQLALLRPDWEVELLEPQHCTKAGLGQLLDAENTPALLFTLSHGVGFHIDDPRQRSSQGAILCQDWPGPAAVGEPLSADHYYCAEDLSSSASVRGLVAFHFACYGAGTPRDDDFAHAMGQRAQIAPEAFVAGLPQRLLGHPAGGALAVVGHIERAWGFSFLWPGAGRQLATFETALLSLLDGDPIGLAMETFNQRYAELACELSSEVEELRFGRKVDHSKLGELWTAHNDARNYVLLGDPAVRVAAGRKVLDSCSSGP